MGDYGCSQAHAPLRLEKPLICRRLLVQAGPSQTAWLGGLGLAMRVECDVRVPESAAGVYPGRYLGVSPT